MIERPIAIESGPLRLAGTACLPAAGGGTATVLMIHGSGPLDRDENTKGQRLDVFNAIARRLARAGVASVRYDKRGCGASTGDYYAAGHFDLIDDALHWVEALQRQDFCAGRPLYLLGHSEGALIAPQVSLRCGSLAGLVLLCPFLDPLEDALMQQAAQVQREIAVLPGATGAIARTLSRVFGQPLATQRKLIERIKASSSDTLRFMLRKFEAKWFRELFSVDPRAVFSRVTCPMLVIGGAKDIQCNPADVAAIAALAQGEVVTHVVGDLTHILRCDTREASFHRYAELLKKPVEPIVLDLIADWLVQRGQGELR